MNIFILDENPALAAMYHCDKHVNKMILESAQMLSTVVGGPYKPTHKHHPCTLWVSESRQNAEWLYRLALHLNGEYRLRYGKTVNHKSWDAIKDIWRSFDVLPDRGLTPFAQAMPEEFKNKAAVTAYRDYYHSKPFVEWKRTTTPDWWMQNKAAIAA